MRITPNSSILLDEGEVFYEERQDKDNVWRTIKLGLRSGAIVTVQRHFSQIGPNISLPDGSLIQTTVKDGAVVPIDDVKLAEHFGFKELED